MNKKFIKSPLNYTGGKYKLLPQILPLFPKDINTFVDLFCGGCNVAVNVNANNIVCNDIEPHVIDMMKYFQKNSPDSVINGVKEIVNKYGLSDTSKYGYEYYGCNSSKGVANYNKDSYNRLRNDYNKNTDDSLYFFTTVIFAFNNQINFNKSGKFNVAVNKRDFNKNVKNNTFEFVNYLNNNPIEFQKSDFRCFNYDNLTSEDFVYCDPPYLISCASYNEQDGWNEEKEKQLLELLDKLNEKEIKFALSNVLYHKGKTNNILIEWCKKYKVHHLNNTYSNCSYHGNKGESDEVLICNY